MAGVKPQLRLGSEQKSVLEKHDPVTPYGPGFSKSTLRAGAGFDPWIGNPWKKSIRVVENPVTEGLVIPSPWVRGDRMQ